MLVALLLPESLPVERRRRQPLGAVLAIYGRLLRDRAYMGYVLSGALIFAGLLAYISGSPFVFIELFHVPPERYGLFFGVNAVGIIAASQINRWLADRVEARRIVGVVLPVAMAASLVLLFDAYTRLRRIRRHPRPAVLLHRLPRLRDAEHDGAGDGAARAGRRQRVGAARHVQFVLARLPARWSARLRQRHGRCRWRRDRRLRRGGVPSRHHVGGTRSAASPSAG